MKKILAVLFAWALVYGPFLPVMTGQWLVVLDEKASGSGPSILFDSINTTGEAAWPFGDDNNLYRAGQQFFTDSVAHSITKIIAPMSATGTISGKSFTCTIWTNSSNDLGTAVGTSNSVTGSNSWSHTNVTFTFASPVSLSASTDYHITIEPTGAFDASNYASGWFVNLDIIPGTLDRFSNTGVNQYPLSFTDYDLQLQIWGTTP